MTPLTYYTNTLEDLKSAAEDILKHCNESRIFLFHGDLGTGKTSLIKYLCEYLGNGDTVNSPTFSIINQYPLDSKNVIYHMDLYRIKDIDELQDIGIDEYLFSNEYCFIEWPKLIYQIYDDYCYQIKIEVDENKCRKIEVRKVTEYNE